MKREIKLENQVRLGPGRCLQLTILQIVYRLFRSMITVSILMLAVTFLSHMLAYTLIEHETRYRAYQQLADARSLGQWIARLSAPADVEQIMDEMLFNRSDETYTPAMRISLDRVAAFKAYLGQLPPAARTVVAGSGSHWRLLADMQRNEAGLAAFGVHLDDLQMPRPTGVLQGQGMQALVTQDFPAIQSHARQLRNEQRDALKQIHHAMAGQEGMVWLAKDADSPEGRAALAAANWQFTEGELKLVSQEARRLLRVQALDEAIQNDQVVRLIARRSGKSVSELSMHGLAHWLADADNSQWFAATLKRAMPQMQVEGDEVMKIALVMQQQKAWTAASGDGHVRPRQGLFDLSRRTQWLLLLSFLVCATGVTNAMFMSVTERFAEIATMKCLGALDGFLIVMFLMESALQGMIGSVLGILLGLGLAFLRSWISFGYLGLTAIPWVDLMWCAAMSILAGMLLAVLAAVGPAWIAARLAPMEAMRID